MERDKERERKGPGGSMMKRDMNILRRRMGEYELKLKLKVVRTMLFILLMPCKLFNGQRISTFYDHF